MKTKRFPFKIIAIFFIVFFVTSCSKKEMTKPIVMDITDAVFASGYVAYSDEYWVTANAEGFILNSYIKEGDKVIKEQKLFEISSEIQTLQSNNARINYQDALEKSNPKTPQILQLKNQITQAEKTLGLDKKNFERYSRLNKSNSISELDYDKAKLQYENSISNLDILKKSLIDLENNLQLQAKNAKNQLDMQNKYFGDYLLRSSLNGIVLEISKNTGELTKKGEMLARIGGGKLITKLYIAEEDINLIKLDQVVILELNTDPNKTYGARVSKIYPAFDDKEQSFVIEVNFTKDLPTLRSGTQVQANIIVEERKNALVIPAQYLINDNKVLLDNKKEIEIETGVKNNDWVEVIKGIDKNTTIILPQNK
jgi:multidrug efflux pump subunit AcrA (membrane-fusion protein)